MTEVRSVGPAARAIGGLLIEEEAVVMLIGGLSSEVVRSLFGLTLVGVMLLSRTLVPPPTIDELLAIVCPPLQNFACLIRLSGKNVRPQLLHASNAFVL